MKFEEIQKLWSGDCTIDETELSQESVKIPQLHNKYLILFHDERLRLRTLKYDHTKNTNFSTILGNEAKWACLNQYNKNKKYLITDSDESRFMYENNLMPQDKPFVDERVLSKIFNLIEHHPDKRVQKIFKLRYVEPKFNKLTPWKTVSQELKMSIQGCIKIHNSAIKIIRKQLKNTHELDI